MKGLHLANLLVHRVHSYKKCNGIINKEYLKLIMVQCLSVCTSDIHKYLSFSNSLNLIDLMFKSNTFYDTHRNLLL